MKYKFILFILVITPKICICQQSYSFDQHYLTLRQGHLKGKVKTVESFLYMVNEVNGEIQKGVRMGRNKKFFSEQGLIQKELEYSMTSINDSIEKFYYYDTLGRLQKSTVPSKNGDLVVYYTYNNDEIIASKKGSSEEDRLTLSSKGYDSILISTNSYPSQREVEKCEYDSQGNPVNQTSIFYEIDGITQKQTNWIQTSRNKYEKSNNLIETIISKKDFINKALYVTVFYEGTNIATKVGSLRIGIKYTKFDKNLNWSKIVKYIDGSPTFITERIITYY